MLMNPLFKKFVCMLIIFTFASVVTLYDAQPAQAGFLKSVCKAIGGAVKGIAKGIGGVVSGVANGIKKAVGGVFDGVKGFVEKVGSFVKEKVVPFLGKIAPIVGVVASVVAPYLAPAFAGIVSAIGTGAKIASTVCSVIQSKGKNLLGAITGIAGSLGGPIGSIVGKVGSIAGKISEGIGMIKSGNFAGLLSSVGGALAGGKLDGVGSFLTGLGADTLANGNGVKGLLGAVGGKLLSSDIAQKFLGGASGLLSGVTGAIGNVQGKVGGLLGNFKGLVGNVSTMLKSGMEGQASGILGGLGGILQKTGFLAEGTGVIDGLAAKLTGIIDKGISAVANFKPADLADKLLPKLADKIKEKLGVSAFDQRLGKLQGFFGNVQQFAVAANSGQGDIALMFANAQAAMQRTGPDTVINELLGQVDFEALKLKFKKEVVSKIEDKTTRKLAEDAVNKLPSDMKLKQELRDVLKDILR